MISIKGLLSHLNSAAEGPWAIAGAVAAIVAAVVVITTGTYEFILRPIRRHRKLKHPCEAWFVIASSKQQTLSYAVQTDSEHYVKELTLAPHFEFEIEVLYNPKISFLASEIYFGCGEQNYQDLETKPIIKSYYSHFIERGTIEESPETHPDTNLADRHKFYHLKRVRNHVRHETYSLGFKLQTREVGRYDFWLFFLSEEVGSATKLSIRVEDPPATRMRCVLRKHRGTKCFIQTIPPV